jgi:hypothetical protein
LMLAWTVHQRCIIEEFQDCWGVCSYLDDIAVFGKNRREHDKNLKVVLQKLKLKD